MNLTQPRQQAQAEQRVVLCAVGYSTYETFLRELGDRPGIRLTFNGWDLELRTPSYQHEWWKHRIGFLVPLLGAALNVEVQGGGSATLRRHDLEKGLDPDECFYVGPHAAILTGPDRELDLTRDLPPDLAIEIGITPGVLNREAIYASLGVRELWGFDGESVRAGRLGPDGNYIPCDRSVAVPLLPMREFSSFLRQTQDLTEMELIRAAPAWARQHALPSPPSP